MPMGTSWSWVPNERYKSTDEIIRTLAQVVTRGGSLLLNVAPGPDGRWDSTAYQRLADVGAWMKANGEAIHGTRASGWETHGAIGCTQSKDGRIHYLLGEAKSGPWSFAWKGREMPKATLLGTGQALSLKAIETGFLMLELPPGVMSWNMVVVKIEG